MTTMTQGPDRQLRPQPAAAGLAPAIVRGTFNLVDLMPTLAALVGGGPPACDGKSVLPELRAGGALAERPSFALGSDAADASLVVGDTKLVRTYDGVVGEGGTWIPPNTSDWYDLAHGEVRRDPPADAERWERALDEWAGRRWATAARRPRPGPADREHRCIQRSNSAC
jgi:hypothetical protein